MFQNCHHSPLLQKKPDTAPVACTEGINQEVLTECFTLLVILLHYLDIKDMPEKLLDQKIETFYDFSIEHMQTSCFS